MVYFRNIRLFWWPHLLRRIPTSSLWPPVDMLLMFWTCIVIISQTKICKYVHYLPSDLLPSLIYLSSSYPNPPTCSALLVYALQIMYIILYTCLFVRINHSSSWSSSHGGHLPGFCLYVLHLASVCSYSCIVLTASCDNIQLPRVYFYGRIFDITFITSVSNYVSQQCQYPRNIKFVHLGLCALLCHETKHPWIIPTNKCDKYSESGFTHYHITFQ